MELPEEKVKLISENKCKKSYQSICKIHNYFRPQLIITKPTYLLNVRKQNLIFFNLHQPPKIRKQEIYIITFKSIYDR